MNDAFDLSKNKEILAANEQKDFDPIKISTEYQDCDLPTVFSPYFNNTQVIGGINILKRKISVDGNSVSPSKCKGTKLKKASSERRKINRFGELTEEEVTKKLLP